MSTVHLEICDSPVVQSDWINGSPRIAFDCLGEGEAVVFLHGVGGNRRNWSAQLAVFGRYFRSIAWDARGYGDSDDYEGPLDFNDFADDLLRLLDHFGIDAAHIVGLSMGGNIALHFAILHPPRVRSLVLCDTDRGMTHIPETDRQEFLRLRRDPLLAGRELADIVPAIVDSLSGPHASMSARQILMESMLSLHKKSYIKSVEATVNFDIRHAIHQIECPTLVAVGEYDQLTPLSEAKAICAGIPHSRMVIIPKAGHVSNVEQPDAFNREVLPFLLDISSRRHV